ncbi:MAG: L-histidine N(alpha)-methyltransferase [Calditrichaeota bacterium]|nr:MAG: L-histidine N(alpha)-methyltransferase [Calditrichota bacterium]
MQVIHNINEDEKTISYSDTEKFALDVLIGLTKRPKSIPAIYHYDAEGSKIFEQITELKEYYPTNCEVETLNHNKEKIAHLMDGEPFNLVEFGSGNGSKTKVLIQQMLDDGLEFHYIPIDISKSVLEELVDDYKVTFPNLEIHALISDYFSGVKWLNKRSDRKNMVLFLGSNIGNFSHPEARMFLRNLWISLNNKDTVLIGFDLKKDIELLLSAYNDSEGVTAEFSLNLLRRMNRELGADFEPSKFRHFATYEVSSGAMESYLVSLERQEVFIKGVGRSFLLKAWEPIHVEYSYKYLISEIETLAEETGYKVVEHMFDSKKYFTDSLWEINKSE